MKKSNIRCYYEYRLKRAKSENKHCYDLRCYFGRFSEQVKFIRKNLRELHDCSLISDFMIDNITDILKNKEYDDELNYRSKANYITCILDELFEIVERKHKRMIDIINEFESEYENKEK